MVFPENFVWRFSSVYFQDKLLQFFQAPKMTVAGTVSWLRFFPFRTFSTRRRITPSRLLPVIISNPTPFFLSSLSSPSSTLQFLMVRYRSSAILNSLTASNSTSLDWTPPLRGPCILDSIYFDCGESAFDNQHTVVMMDITGFEFMTEQALFHHYIRTLASVVGSEEEAKRKIYFVSCEISFGFAAKIDEDTTYKLSGQPGISYVFDDVWHKYRKGFLGVQSLACFTLKNDHQRLDNVFSYYHLSERNSEWNYDHWLIIINQHDGGFSMGTQTLDFIIKILADAIGSEQEAKEKIYMIWSSFPIGFGAEIDEKTSNKLKGHPSVLKVLPDYSFDVKDKVPGGALSIWHSQKSCFRYHSRRYMATLFRESTSTCIQLPPLMPLDSNC